VRRPPAQPWSYPLSLWTITSGAGGAVPMVILDADGNVVRSITVAAGRAAVAAGPWMAEGSGPQLNSALAM